MILQKTHRKGNTIVSKILTLDDLNRVALKS